MGTLYKYMSSKIALLCLPEVGNGTLRATQLAALNDPFEGALKPEYLELSEQRENEELAVILTSINPTNPITAEDVSEARKKYRSLYVRELAAQQISRTLGIVSFSEDKLNPLLWSHYTVYGSGFVVGYDKEVLMDLSPNEGSLRRVEYVKQLPAIQSPTDLLPISGYLNQLLSTKSTLWNYEKEWRLIVELSETVGTGRVDALGQPINLICVPNRAVVSVYCTDRTPSDAINTIESRLGNSNNRYTAVRTQKLVMSKTLYGYEEAPAGS